MNLLFVHIPRNINDGGKLDRYEIMVMPVGIFTLADHFSHFGGTARIIHLGIEKLLNPDFSLVDFIRSNGFDAVGMGLHWNFQVVDVLDTAAMLKNELPDVPIILGGLSASNWAEEILRENPAVDYVIRGEAEKPLVQLSKAIESHEGFENVPNLAWRSEGRVVLNDISYLNSQEDIDSFDFAALHLMEHHEEYGGRTTCRALDREFEEYKREGVFYTVPGRGCGANCAHCGGSSQSFKKVFNRSRPVLMNPESGLRNIMRAHKAGYEKFWLSCELPEMTEPYYLKLFEMIRKSGVSLGGALDCAGLPSQKLIRDFAATFDPRISELILYTVSGDVSRRLFFSGFSYTNQDLRDIIALAASLGVRTNLRATFFPGETMDSIRKYAALLEQIERESGAKITLEPNLQDPACPWQLDPERYGVFPTATTARDYYEMHSRTSSLGNSLELGYRFDDFDKLWMAFNYFIPPQPVEMYTLTDFSSGRRKIIAHENMLDRLPEFIAASGFSPDAILIEAGDKEAHDAAQTLEKLHQACKPRLNVFRVAVENMPFINANQSAGLQAGKLTKLQVSNRRSALDFLNLYWHGDWVSALNSSLNRNGSELSCACRWTPSGCPALNNDSILIDAHGNIRFCDACKPVGTIDSSLDTLFASFSKSAASVGKKRECAACPVRSHCAKCVFTKPFTPDEYCFVQRMAPSHRRKYKPDVWKDFPGKKTKLLGIPDVNSLLAPMKQGGLVAPGHRLARPVIEPGAVVLRIDSKTGGTTTVRLTAHQPEQKHLEAENQVNYWFHPHPTFKSIKKPDAAAVGLLVIINSNL